MCPVIRISGSLYSRLEEHAEGFDTPAGVIERLLNENEGVDLKEEIEPRQVQLKRPVLVFHPLDEKAFLRKLVDRKTAWVNLHYQDGSIETAPWHADSIRPTSNLRANIWSGKLRGWKEKGIVKAEYFFDTKDIS